MKSLKVDPGRVAPSRTGPGQRGGQPLPGPLLHTMESSFAADFSTVRVHVGHEATHLGVASYTRGEDIHFAPGHYDPVSARGQELIGHELAHVQQHRSGQVPDVPRGMVEVALEPEADQMGERAATSS